MYWYAQIDENNIVKQVHACVPEEQADTDASGQAYMNNVLNLSGTWLKTDFNTQGGKHFTVVNNVSSISLSADGLPGFRGNFAKVGMLYNKDVDVFVVAAPFPSWTLNTTTLEYDPPVPRIIDTNWYKWNESTLSWTYIMALSSLQQIVNENAKKGIFTGQY